MFEENFCRIKNCLIKGIVKCLFVTDLFIQVSEYIQVSDYMFIQVSD